MNYHHFKMMINKNTLMQKPASKIRYKINEPICAEQYIDLLRKTSLGERRPLDEKNTIQMMLDHANLIVTAWADRELIGISRCLTDFGYCCYLSDLAVAEAHQHEGIGKQLIEVTQAQLKPDCTIILLAAPQATGYYNKIGFIQHPSAWIKKIKD